MIKLIIFDLDGVLIDTKELHYEALNEALKSVDEKYVISESEHLTIYDGLNTDEKLKLLTLNKGLPTNKYKDIWNLKQSITLDKLDSIVFNKELYETFEKLKQEGYILACGSNSITPTVMKVIEKLEIKKFLTSILSNQDVNRLPKPHPNIYWKTMSLCGVLPNETLIIEDSPNGLKAAYSSNANVLRVKNSKDVNYEKIINKINFIKNKENKWEDEEMNVLIPMAGAGSRFKEVGYVNPKPLIDVNGEPMIKVVSDNLNIKANFIYIVQKSHREKYNLDVVLNLISPNCKIVEVDGLTDGAARTTLIAKELINNSKPLLIANSDQFIEWDSNQFLYKMNETNVDGGIVTFKAKDPKWSFVKLGSDGLINEVAEKKQISEIATVGVYFWKHGSDYVKFAERMIDKDIRVNNEFYVCPVFNEAIAEGKKIINFDIKKMWGIGTPDDLEYFLKNYNQK